MGRNDQGRVFQETAASGKVAWLRVPVFAPERPGVTGRMSTETRDFLSTFLTGAGIAVFALAVGLITGREIVILASLPAGVGCAILWRASVVYERVNTVMEAETGLRPEPPTPAPEPAADLRFFSTASGTRVAFPAGWDNDLLVRWAKECVRRRFDMAHRTWHPRSEGKMLSRNLFDALLGMLAGQGHYADGELTASGRRVVTAWADGKTDAV